MAIGVAINSQPPNHISHKILIGSPLVLVSLFCLAYMVVAPHPYQQAVSSQSGPSSPNKSVSSTKNANLNPLPKLDLVVTPAAAASNDLSGTVSPQTSASSSPNVNLVPAAAANTPTTKLKSSPSPQIQAKTTTKDVKDKARGLVKQVTSSF